MKVRSRLALGLALIALGVLWTYIASPYWKQRFPDGWGPEFNFIGISTVPDLETGQFPPTDSTGLYQRVFKVIARSADAVTLQDHYIIRDPASGEITYDYTYEAEVDPLTGAHLDPQYQGDYYLFPRGVEKKTYRIRHSFLEGIPLAFQFEENIEGLQSYLFSYLGPAEYTESYLGLEDSLGRRVEAGQEVRCADDQFRLDMWVEPVTGSVLKIDESCYSGDYVYDLATGDTLFPVLRWGAVTAGDDVQARSDIVRNERMRYLWATRYLPLALFGTGLIYLFTFAYSSLANSRLAKWRRRDAQTA